MTFPKRREVQIPILLELYKAGGSERASVIWSRVSSYFPGLTQEDLEQRTDDGFRKWDKLVQWVRLELVNRGELDRTERGGLASYREGGRSSATRCTA